MNLHLSTQSSKQEVFSSLRTNLSSLGLNIINEEYRPWGGFFVIDESQTKIFIDRYFTEVETFKSIDNQHLSPKFLIVNANKRLSWQYHHRREEIWKVIYGPVGIVRSKTDTETILEKFDYGEIIYLSQGERHRLIGLENWGIVAEIWKHTIPSQPSDENDIVRITDDFGR